MKSKKIMPVLPKKKKKKFQNYLLPKRNKKEKKNNYEKGKKGNERQAEIQTMKEMCYLKDGKAFEARGSCW